MYERRLERNQKVLIIYNTTIGFTSDLATFKEYRRTKVGKVSHETPVFQCGDKEITGLECFWIPDGVSPEEVERVQKTLIPLQVKALEMGLRLGYEIPEKIRDPEIRKMAQENVDKMEVIIKKFGFDPRDESWIEAELAQTPRERNWFRFERENAAALSDNWDDIAVIFNKQFGDKVSTDEARILSKKRMRYLLGAFHMRMSGLKDRKQWIKEARDFEKTPREREQRMREWSEAHRDKFPIVKTKKEVSFFFGPYFNECIENIPQVFTDIECKKIKPGVPLRVVSYDPEIKFIRLDFLADVRKIIKGEDDPEPWIKDKADYDIWLKPEEIETHLEVLERLE